ncbi:MAG TPA: hypothetical protein VH440_09220 [Candidatus Limnocylindrales bacterium]
MQTTSREDERPGDDAPRRLTRAATWALRHWPASARRRVAAVAAIALFAVALIPIAARVAGFVIDLGVLPYLALMALCWLGMGGALVPIPGVRFLSWVTIVQQGGALQPLLVTALAGFAMALGQTSIFVAARSGEGFVRSRTGGEPTGEVEGGAGAEGPGTPPPAAAATAQLAPAAATAQLAPAATAIPEPARAAVTAEPTAQAATESASGARRFLRDGRARLARASTSVGNRIASAPRRTIFFASLLPSPLTTLSTVAAASVGVPFRTFFVTALAGFLVFSAVLAILGQSLIALFHL